MQSTFCGQNTTKPERNSKRKIETPPHLEFNSSKSLKFTGEIPVKTSKIFEWKDNLWEAVK